MANEALAVRGGDAIQQTKEGFGTSEITRANEMATTALAAQARAQIEARYIVAMRNPRDLDTVRIKLLKECARPGFAAVARYKKPVGKNKEGVQQYVEGPSIRFAEAAIRYMGNISAEPTVIWDDEQRRNIRVAVTDVESNVVYSNDFVVPKTVERKYLKKGQQALGTRTNSYGELVYIVPATSDEVDMKVAALVSKALRTNGLRLVPGDIIEECMSRVLETQNAEVKSDPDAVKKRLLDAFAKLNVMPAQISAYLGHDVAGASPAELVELRAVYSAISDGETTWAALTAKESSDESDEKSQAQKAVEAVKEKLAKKAVPANKQTQIVDAPADELAAAVGTEGPKRAAKGVTVNGRFNKQQAGKPLSSLDAAARVEYLRAVRECVVDLKENQPDGWEGLLKAVEPHLALVEAEDESLRAEGQ